MRYTYAIKMLCCNVKIYEVLASLFKCLWKILSAKIEKKKSFVLEVDSVLHISSKNPTKCAVLPV